MADPYIPYRREVRPPLAESLGEHTDRQFTQIEQSLSTLDQRQSESELQDVATTELLNDTVSLIEETREAFTEPGLSFAESVDSLQATVGDHTASITEQSGAITDLEGRTEAYWEVTAVAGGRASLSVHADANGGGGVDIVGDVRITGDVTIDGNATINGLIDGTFPGTKLEDSAVSGPKIDESAVTGPKIDDAAVSTVKIADDSITLLTAVSFPDSAAYKVLSYPTTIGGVLTPINEKLNQEFTFVKSDGASSDLEVYFEVDLTSENDLITRTQLWLSGPSGAIINSPSVICIVSDGGADTWISESRSHVFTGLPAGTYTVNIYAAVYSGMSGYPTGSGTNKARAMYLRAIEFRK